MIGYTVSLVLVLLSYHRLNIKIWGFVFLYKICLCVMIKKIPVRTLAGSQLPSIIEERFRIRRIEDIIGPTGLVYDLHRHDFYFILALRSGSGEHEIDFEFLSSK